MVTVKIFAVELPQSHSEHGLSRTLKDSFHRAHLPNDWN